MLPAMNRKRLKKNVAANEASMINYEIPVDPERLYKTSFSDIEKMPLDLFDDGEMELRSPREWLERGPHEDLSKDGVPVHASSLWCEQYNWIW